MPTSSKKNIAIIGAGPIGCYAGYLLAKAGNNVTIYENHPQVGLPIQCTGLLTSDFDEFNLPLDSFLVNTFTTIEVFSPQQRLEVQQKEYLVCRKRFDNFFADQAREAGAAILVNHSFTRKEGKNIIITNSQKKKEMLLAPDIVIAADGPLSPTAKAYGLYHPKRENYYGIQATVEGVFNPTSFQTYFGVKVCPELFAWVVPESATLARVGLAMRKNSKAYFDAFMNEHHFVAKDIQAGTIPVYSPNQKLQQDNCYLLGDAAGFVKATTLGGLVPGLKQAEILAECLIHDRNYQRETAALARKLRLHLVLRRVFDKFSDHDWDRLITYMNKPQIQKILSQHTRDNPIPLVGKALLAEPRFLGYAKYLV